MPYELNPVWCPIPGYEQYLISENGNIFSLKSMKILKKQLNRDGHPCVTLYGKPSIKYNIGFALRKIKHPEWGYRTLYEHMKDIPAKNKDDRLIQTQ